MTDFIEYQGKMIDKRVFRAFIYSADGAKKLVKSYDDYVEHMQTGIWFDEPQSITETPADVAEETPKKRASNGKRTRVRSTVVSAD